MLNLNSTHAMQPWCGKQQCGLSSEADECLATRSQKVFTPYSWISVKDRHERMSHLLHWTKSH